MDNKRKKGVQDDSKIDVNDPNEVEYAAKEFEVTRAEIRNAIKTVGNSRERVRAFLKQKNEEEE